MFSNKQLGYQYVLNINYKQTSTTSVAIAQIPLGSTRHVSTRHVERVERVVTNVSSTHKSIFCSS